MLSIYVHSDTSWGHFQWFGTTLHVTAVPTGRAIHRSTETRYSSAVIELLVVPQNSGMICREKLTKLINKNFNIHKNRLDHQRNRLDFVPNDSCPQLGAGSALLQSD